MAQIWHWIPGKSIGPFIFGERVEQYVADYGLCRRKPDCATADWDTFEFPGFESWIIAEKGCVIGVHCEDAVEFHEENIIGMSSPDIHYLLGKETSKEENVGFGHALYYDQLGLTLFMVNGAVSAASCGLIVAD